MKKKQKKTNIILFTKHFINKLKVKIMKIETKKMEYQTPEMEVVKVEHQEALLAGSGTPAPEFSPEELED
ncbi:MAG: hypothetical protein IJ544_08845 [Prevotella sp.]|nr:hypothetical protein [Prevotella sp.]